MLLAVVLLLSAIDIAIPRKVEPVREEDDQSPYRFCQEWTIRYICGMAANGMEEFGMRNEVWRHDGSGYEGVMVFGQNMYRAFSHTCNLNPQCTYDISIVSF